MRSPATAEIEK